MGYEIVNHRQLDCPCKKGKIEWCLLSNDWGQEKETINIECDECKSKYEIVYAIFCPKPKHDYKIYYCKNKENGEKIKLNI